MLLAVTTLSLRAATPTAADIMDKMRRTVLASPAVEAQFTIRGGQGGIQGSATMHGAAFTFATPQIQVWYDGSTQWALLESTKEVSITEPTAEELALVNPFAIMQNYEQSYTMRRLADSNGRSVVQLTPKDKTSAIRKVVVTADKDGKWPQELVVIFDDGRAIDLYIDRISGRQAPPVSTFRYNTKLHPAAEVIDLR